MTIDNKKSFELQGLGSRKVIADFLGGDITSDAGSLLLREVDEGMGLFEKFASCFVDYRDPELIEHTVKDLVSQRVYGIALGYEDLNDHDRLRLDPLMATVVGKQDPTGQDRSCLKDRGKALAGKSTLNRLELTPEQASFKSRYQKIVYDQEAVDRFFVDMFLSSYKKAPEEIIIDMDATDDPLHGNQEGRFFHGYYNSYCYLPLYIFCGDHLLLARLRPSNIDASAGSAGEIERIVDQIRDSWPEVRIVIRGDGGFCREDLMSWCESHRVDYVFGMSKNARLIKKIQKKLNKSKRRYCTTGHPSRRYQDFKYRTLTSWSRSRRVVGKAEHLEKGANPRFVVTSLFRKRYGTQDLYEKLYCARGDMENRIKEQQLGLFADRTSTAKMRANQLRLYFSSVAYVLMNALRRVGLKGTEFAKAQCSTIRSKVLKVGAQVKLSVRRVLISMASSYPYAILFWKALKNIHTFFYPLRT